MSKLLIQEPPVMFQKSLAVLYGQSEAIFLQQLHYWLQTSTNEYEGRRWIYKTRKEWLEQDFPFFSDSTLKRVIKHLRDEGIIIVSNFNKMKQDKTSWYTIDYEALVKNDSPLGQNDPCNRSDWSNGRGQIDPMEEVKLTQALTREYTENTQKNNNRPSGDGRHEEDFEKLWQLYPRKERRKAAYQAYIRAIKKGVTNKQIQDGIVAYKRHIKQQNIEQRFVKQGGTWFYQECWNDDYQYTPETVVSLGPSFDEQMRAIHGSNWKELMSRE